MQYRSALVTGAGGPLGGAMARTLAERGVRVHVVGQHPTRLRQLARSIADHGGWARAHPEPSCEPERRLELVRKLDDQIGGLDLVIANLHGAGPGHLPGAGDAAGSFGPGLATATLNAALPAMRARNRGQIACVLALSTRRDAPAAARYAFNVMMGRYLRSMREHLRGTGVAVTEARVGPVRRSSPGLLARIGPGTVDARDAAEAVVDAVRQGRTVFTFPWHAPATARAGELLGSLG